MRILRRPALTACALLTVFAAAATTYAQDARDTSTGSVTSGRYWYRPIIRVAQDFTLARGDVANDVRVIFGNAIIEGQVDGDVLVVLGSARLSPTAVVDGTVAVIGGSANIDASAMVRRDLVIIGGTLEAPAAFSPGGDHVVIGSLWFGDRLQDVVPWITRGLLWGRLIVPDLAWIWTAVGIFFLLYLALNVVFDRPVSASADALAARPLSMFMAGLLVLLLAIPALVIVAATVIGLALVPFMLCALIVTGLLGKAAVARAIGRSIIRSDATESRAGAVAAFVIGFALLTLAYMVPFLGFVTWALTTVMGFGAATVTFRSMLRRERPRATPPPPVAPPAVHRPGEGDAPALAMSEPFEAPVPPPVASAAAAMPESRPALMAGLAQYPRATFLDRLAAFALDCVLIAIVAELMDWNRHEGYFPLLLLAYHIAFWAWKGTTLGGIICSLRVIRTTGGEIRPADALIRGLSSVFSLAALGIGCFWMLQDRESQTWHDKIAGTLVVKVPREMALP